MTDAIILDMDESREIKWTFGAIKKFEGRGRDLLKQLKIVGDRGQAITNIHAGALLANFGRISEIMEAAVAATTGLSGIETKDGPSPASSAIDAYLQHSGSLEELQRAVYKAYLAANDPSSLQEWAENIARDAELKRMTREKADLQIEQVRKELERLKTSGNALIASPTSS